MVLITYPDYVKKMKDSFGFHRVKVYKDTRILKDIIHLRVKAQEKDQDSIYLVCGIEGSGKSLFTLMAAELYEQETNSEVPIENVCRTLDEMMQRLAKLERKAFITLDEGSELDSGRWNEKKTKEIKSKFTAIRERAFIIFICYTNPLKIVTYLREDRIRGVFFIKSPGIIYYYANSPDNPHFTEILERWSKDNKTKSLKVIQKYNPDFIMYYPEYKGKLRELYRHRKNQHITTILDNGDMAKDAYYTPVEAMRAMCISRFRYDKLLNSGQLHKEKVGLKELISRSEVENLIEKFKISVSEGNDANILKTEKIVSNLE